MYTPEKKYTRRINIYSKMHEVYSTKSSSIGNFKLLEFVLGAALVIIMFVLKQYIVMLAAAAVFLSGFIYLSIIQNRVIKNKNYCISMLKINQMSLDRVKGLWRNFYDRGEEFETPEHRFTHDLDLFGKGSLFQMVNTTTTYSGRHSLAGILSTPLEEQQAIIERQEAIKELSNKLIFRQRLFLNALLTNSDVIIDQEEGKTKKKKRTLLDTINSLEDIFEWAKAKEGFYTKKSFKILITALPILTIITLILAILKVVPGYLPIAGYVIQFLMLGYRINFRNRSFELVEKYSGTLKIYSSVIKQFELEKFESKYMLKLKEDLTGQAGQPAWKQIERLSKLWDVISNRYNFLHVIINTATLWDYHCIFALEKWKSISGNYVEKWFNTIGEVEAISSLSVFRHDNPHFTMPEVTEDLKAGIKAKELGHPLLGEERKCNDISISVGQPIVLITGSNMSGKSTFLRTVGLSLTLAYIGLPVCAERFCCPVLKVYACMRTSDNLGQSVSSFYAELLRVKLIVDAVKRGEKVFFLLDEIFKGTNSADRHTGAKMLINQLDKQGAWGMVSTHDLELADLEKDSRGRIRNYHFKEYYRDLEIFFDYKLREGVSDTRNAIYLMKMSGVEIDNL